MRALMIGQAGVGKTRTAIALMGHLQGKTMFFSELPKNNVLQIASKMDSDLSNVEINIWRPSINVIELADSEYDNIVIDHWLRIKDIDSRRQRSRLFDIIEHSIRNWLILAHTLKGREIESIDSGKWTSGLDAVVDVAYGVLKYGDKRALKILKDRYNFYEGRKYSSMVELIQIFQGGVNEES